MKGFSVGARWFAWFLAAWVTGSGLAEAGPAAEAEARGDHAAAITAAEAEIAALQPQVMAFDPRLLALFNIEGDAYAALGRRGEAEAAYRTVEERLRIWIGPDELLRLQTRRELIHALAGLGDLAAGQGKLDEAEALARKVKRIADGVLPAGDPLRGIAATRLANVLAGQGKSAEAAVILRDAQPQGLAAALALKTAAQLNANDGDYDAAAQKLREAIGLIETLAGTGSDLALTYRADLAAVLIGAQRFTDAESVLRGALAQFPDRAVQRPDVGAARAALAYTLAAQDRWNDCYAEALSAEAAFAGWTAERAAAPAAYDGQFVHDLVAVSAWHVMQDHPERKDEMMAAAFAAMQRNQAPKAAAALLQMAVRGAAGDADLANAVRTLQDEQMAFAADDKSTAKTLGGTGISTKILYAGSGGSRYDRLIAAQKIIEEKFPAYRDLAGLSLLPLGDVASLLGEDDVLVIPYVSHSQVEASMVWAITRDTIWWAPLSAEGLTGKIKALRQAIDPSGATRGVTESGADAGTAAGAGFDASVAVAVYRQLFGNVNELMLSKRHAIIVPSPALAALPFEVLARAAPSTAGDLRSADWLIRHQSLSILPSIAALKLLKNFPARESYATSFAGFGNPDTSRYNPDLAPLPGTVPELQSLAASLGADPQSLRLAAEATPGAVKSADLSGVKVLAFATHGLLPGQVEGLQEPALVLSPDATGSGYLTASDVAGLRLSADFVILSACNTAGGDAESGEGFSGLARSFFYAGAHALLASHWPVYSDAAVKLTTGTLKAMAAEPGIGKDEALQRAMLDILDHDPNPAHWQPAYWGPFALIGSTGR